MQPISAIEGTTESNSDALICIASETMSDTNPISRTLRASTSPTVETAKVEPDPNSTG